MSNNKRKTKKKKTNWNNFVRREVHKIKFLYCQYAVYETWCSYVRYERHASIYQGKFKSIVI